MELDPTLAGQIELHKPFGIEILPIRKGEWDVWKIFDAYELFEEQGRQYRVRVLRQLPDEPSVLMCVASFPPENE